MKLFVFLFWISFPLQIIAADSLSVRSPDGNIVVTIHYKKELMYEIAYRGKLVLLPSSIDLELLNGPRLGADLRVRSSSVRLFDQVIISPVPEKRKEIRDWHQQLTVQFRQPFTLEFRVYNDGVAYRLLTRMKDSITIKNELARFVFPSFKKAYLPIIEKRKDADRYHTSFEEKYLLKSIDSIGPESLAYTPILAGDGDELKIGLTESDLFDYPGMFIAGTNTNSLLGVFANYPLEEKMMGGEFKQAVVTKRSDYIARTNGTRSFPWRVLMIAAEDKDLPGNDIVYRLGQPSKLTDFSWVHPGKGTDEWIIGINLFNVPFKSGVNTATYKYYIDFAKEFGFDRIMMDAGWSNYENLLDINTAINMDSISAYARDKGIHLSMWTLAATLDRQLDSALDQFNKWGVDFIMTDFMDRDDQVMVNFYHRIAKACADHKIMIMFHGAFPPKGFNRSWPNAITREGVLGSEYNIWSDKPDPEHDLMLPFTRMLAGSLDYEPGILDNATKAQFRPISQKVQSQGTRCHQLAMFVVFDSPLQIFSGNPSQGKMEPEFMKLLGSLPTVWDETKIIDARVSDYIITARKKGDDWFVGGMTDWSSRQFQMSTDFLAPGIYEATLCEDGINAATYASDYVIRKFEVGPGKTIPVQMAPGGGFLIRFTKK